MLGNIMQPRLCNDTLIAGKKLLNNMIEATNRKRKCKGEEVLITLIPMIPTGISFEFKRLLFPVRLAFAGTLSESQGQSLTVYDIHLEKPCFSQSYLYVVCSRVETPSALFVSHQVNKQEILCTMRQ